MKPGKPYKKRSPENGDEKKRPSSNFKRRPNSGPRKSGASKKKAEPEVLVEEMRLNKFIAHAGICSRREADTLIADGKVKVNNAVIREMGYKVKTTDKVEVDNQRIVEESFEYILLNKQRGTITTTSDEKGRKTVMDTIEHATGARVYPVGRLDRNTTGLLLLTNDGDLANRLMHPSYEISKTYKVTIDREFTQDDVAKLRSGITLEDGPSKAYNIKGVEGDPYSLTLSLHEGRNRQIRRMMEALGAEVQKLSRITYAGLTMAGLRSGRWRHLKQREVNMLRSKVKLMEFKHKK